MKRGELWWTAFDPAVGAETRKTRPAVIITADAVIERRRTVIVVPLSTGPSPRPPVTVAMPSVTLSSVAVCDQARCMDKSRLIRRIGPLDGADLAALGDALAEVLDL